MISPASYAGLEAAGADDLSPAETLDHQSHHEMRDDVAYLSLSAMAERTDSQGLSAEGLSYLTMLYAATGISGSDLTLPLHENEALSGPLPKSEKTGHQKEISAAPSCVKYIRIMSSSLGTASRT